MSLTIRHTALLLSMDIWYAHYDDTTGELLSLGTVAPDPVPPGTAFLHLLGQPSLSLYEWDTTLRVFVPRDEVLLFDRIADLVADESLASVWATLDSTQDQALQDRIAAMIGPHRYRLDFQPTDLE